MSNNFYNGNPNIKKAGIPEQYTKEQIDEYIKCAQNPIYFIKKYVKIISLDEGLVFFDVWDFQEKMIDTFHKNRFVINLLPRQMGKTITVAAFLLHYSIFNPEKSVGILANKAATAREILARMKRMIENLPFFLQPGIKEYNKGSVEFGNGSVVMAAATSSDSIRGFSFNVVYLDEFAFVDGADEFYTSTYPVISSGRDTKVLITSTPNGMNLFHKIWTEAKLQQNDFVPIQVHWSENPNRDEQWKQTTLRNIGEKRFAQEYECTFYGSSGTLIDGKKLAELTWAKPIKETENLKVYESPRKGNSYVMTVDVSEGAGSDFTVINITDISDETYKQVAVWRSNRTSPLILPEILERLAIQYNNANVLIETNSVGAQVATMLYHEYEYENIIITKNKNGENVISFNSSMDYGLRTTQKSKRIGCSNIKSLIENDLYIIQDYDTVAELQTFSKRGKSYEAEDGKHDDLVMSLVIFGWLASQDYFEDMSKVSMKEAILQRKMEIIDEDIVPIGFHDDIAEAMEFEENYVSTYI